MRKANKMEVLVWWQAEHIPIISPQITATRIFLKKKEKKKNILHNLEFRLILINI